MHSNILFATILGAAPFLAAAAASCTSHVISVTTNANNGIIFAPNFDLTSPDGVLSFLSSGAGLLGQFAGLLPVSGTYNIAAKYCAPALNPNAPPARAKEVQLLLHGVPYNSVSICAPLFGVEVLTWE